MSTTRRRVLQGVATTGAVAGVAGFSALSHWLTPLFQGPDGALGGFAPPDTPELDRVSHVLNRLTYGIRPGDREEVALLGESAWLEQQLHPERVDDGWTEARIRHFEALQAWPAGELLEFDAKEILDQMTRAHLLRAVHSRRQLLEVMVGFWSDHFNIDPSKGDSRWLKPLDDQRVIRAHALGKFRDLVRASALSPAMLWYLDGRMNQKAHGAGKPNENYARELLELHTLGVNGGYTQQDVMEVARCLTGWTVRARAESRFAVGKVEFHPELHDDGPKMILGQRIPPHQGERDLEHVVDLLCNHPATAKHVAWKLCRRFIQEDPPEPCQETVARAFVASSGDIRTTLRALFSSPEFSAARSEKIKRPFHFVVSALRACSARTDAGPALQDYLLRMGHAPFQFPTPDGYPEEAGPWMATLLWRWKFALNFVTGGLPGTTANLKRLEEFAGGPDGLASHLLGRQPSAEEARVLQVCGQPVALLLASPCFQTF